jgi:hypothetical protein
VAQRQRKSGSGNRRNGGPSAAELAHEATAEWGLAARYAAAAMKPAVGRATEAVKERVRARGEGPSLKDRLNPAVTDKGGRAGDLADFALAKMGKPGALAAKAGLGSRIVERLRPAESEDGAPRDEADEEAEAFDEAEEESEETGDPDDVAQEPGEAETEEDPPTSNEHEHAYSEEVESYEHHDAYPMTRS